MPSLLELAVRLLEWGGVQCERAWLWIECACLESELEYLDRQIEKQQKILALLEAEENRRPA